MPSSLGQASNWRDKIVCGYQQRRDTVSGSTPYPLAILLCDQIIVDERSKKKTLVGIFDSIYARQFPVRHRSLSVYVRVTDAEGQYEFRMDYVQVKTDKLLGTGKILAVPITDRLKAHELIMEFPPIEIPEAGDYEFRLWANGRYIGRAKFAAVEVAKGR